MRILLARRAGMEEGFVEGVFNLLTEYQRPFLDHELDRVVGNAIPQFRDRVEGEPMSTNDVPGANAKNFDKLAPGCWAEHDDGSLVIVLATEANRVLFEVFDTTEEPITTWKYALTLAEFNKRFSVPPTGASDIKWVWHDKTDFPIDRIIEEGAKPGPDFASATDQLSAAERLRRSLGDKGVPEAAPVDPASFAHLRDQILNIPGARKIWEGIQDALKSIRP